MCKIAHLLALAILGGAVMAPIFALADRLPIGLDLRHGIFVQETWQDNSPQLCVANRSGKDQTLVVSRWRSRTLSSEALLRWPMEAGSTRCHDASALGAESLIEYRLLDGPTLGLLYAPKRPTVKGVDASSFANFIGINGTCPTPGTWTEQTRQWMRGGNAAKLDLLIAAEPDGALIEFSVDVRLDLPQLKPKSATSPSLSIERDGNRLSIKADPGTTQAALHRVQLEFDVPAVTQPTMYLLSGRKRIVQTGWQCFVRGILIEP